MKVQLTFVPPEGGEADYSLIFDMQALPRPGDYISVTRPQAENERYGTSDFIVRRTWWHLNYPSNAVIGDPKNPVVGSVVEATVECEFALGPYSTDEHKASCNMYRSRGKPLQEFQASAY